MKKRKSLIMTGIVILLIPVLFISCQKFKIQNIFDEIYYAGAGATGKAFEKPRSIFKNIPSIQRRMIDTTLMHSYEEQVTKESYNEENLPSNMEDLSITFLKKDTKMYIDFTISINMNIILFMHSEYDVKERILTKRISFSGSNLGERYTTKKEVESVLKKYNITNQQLDSWYEIGMNEILLPDWIKVASSQYSVKILGKIEIKTEWENRSL